MLARWVNSARTGWPLSREVDQLFGDVFGTLSLVPARGTRRHSLFPAMNVWEDERTLYVEAELPGMKMDEVEVLVHGKTLTIKGERKAGSEDDTNCLRRECPTGTFTRTIGLPVETGTDGAEAALRDGVLRLTLPKAARELPRKIAISE